MTPVKDMIYLCCIVVCLDVLFSTFINGYVYMKPNNNQIYSLIIENVWL